MLKSELLSLINASLQMNSSKSFCTYYENKIVFILGKFVDFLPEYKYFWLDNKSLSVVKNIIYKEHKSFAFLRQRNYQLKNRINKVNGSFILLLALRIFTPICVYL